MPLIAINATKSKRNFLENQHFLTVAPVVLCGMNKKHPEEKAQRISTTIPSDLHQWVTGYTKTATPPLGFKTSLSTVISAALNDFRNKVEAASQTVEKEKKDTAKKIRRALGRKSDEE